MFARRHYETIAHVIQNMPGYSRPLEAIAADFAAMFARDNDAFDYDQFLRACVPGAKVKKRT